MAYAINVIFPKEHRSLKNVATTKSTQKNQDETSNHTTIDGHGRETKNNPSSTIPSYLP